VILQLTRLYEALIIISNKVSGDDRPEDQDLKPLVVAFSNYLQTISEVTHISLTNENPPAVEIREIIRKRILNISENENISGEEEKDRRFFKTLLEQDGWKWSDLDAKSS
jgi:hypothetical protein